MHQELIAVVVSKGRGSCDSHVAICSAEVAICSAEVESACSASPAKAGVLVLVTSDSQLKGFE